MVRGHLPVGMRVWVHLAGQPRIKGRVVESTHAGLVVQTSDGQRITWRDWYLTPAAGSAILEVEHQGPKREEVEDMGFKDVAVEDLKPVRAGGDAGASVKPIVDEFLATGKDQLEFVKDESDERTMESIESALRAYLNGEEGSKRGVVILHRGGKTNPRTVLVKAGTPAAEYVTKRKPRRTKEQIEADKAAKAAEGTTEGTTEGINVGAEPSAEGTGDPFEDAEKVFEGANASA